MEKERLMTTGDEEVMEVVLTRTDKHEFVGVGRRALDEDDLAAVDSGAKLSEVWRRIADNLVGREDQEPG